MRIAIALLCACKSGSTPPSAGSAASPAGSAVTAPSHLGSDMAALAAPLLDAGAALAKQAEQCTAPCRLLVDTALADAPARFQRECKSAWPYTECDDNLYQVNCIYAVHGYTFKRPEWIAKFRNEPWYQPRADFKESELSAQENASIHELKQRDRACHAEISEPVSADDLALVKSTLADLNATNDADERVRNMMIADKTKLRYTAKSATERTIEIDHPYWAVDAGKYVDASFRLTFDGANKFLGLD